MNKTIRTFGLIAGGILSAIMLLTIPFEQTIGYDHSEIIGYTTMVLAFMMIFFGIRSYRDTVGRGAVTLSRALVIGGLITVVASVCYVATWEVIYYKLSPGFMDKYQAHMIEKAKASGESQAAIDARVSQIRKMAVLYQNPLINSGITFLEPLPVGLIITLVSAGILSSKARTQ